MCETCVVMAESGNEVRLRVHEYGSGRPILLLHGGSGTASLIDFAALFADRAGARVLMPTHPGFDGTDRPSEMNTIRALALIYARLLQDRSLEEVTVVGTSMGGWIAAELVLEQGDLLGRAVLVDAIGIEVAGHPVTDIFSLRAQERAEMSYHDPAHFSTDPSELDEDQKALVAGNIAAFKTYANHPSMTDPTLKQRLSAVSLPTLFVWGESDKVVTPEYGRAYSDSVPNATYAALPAAGHYPQLERPDELADLIVDFIES